MTTPAFERVEPSAHHGLLGMVTLPFRERDWFAKLWWLGLLDYVPVLNLIVLRGWRYEVTRRIAHCESPLLPEPALLGRFLTKGVLLWTMTFAYALIPVIIIPFSGWGGIAAALDAFWLIASLPVYRASMVRYCVTGRVTAFFDFAGAVRFILAFPGAFAKLYLYWFLLTIGLSIVAAILTVTVIGAFVVPLFALPVYYWTTAAEYGQLGRKLIEHESATLGQTQSSLRVLVPSAVALLLFGFCSKQTGDQASEMAMARMSCQVVNLAPSIDDKPRADALSLARQSRRPR